MNVKSILGAAVGGCILAAVALSGCGTSAPDIPEYLRADQTRVSKIRDGLGGEGGGGTAAADEKDPDGWGTLTGTFRFEKADAAKLAARPPLAVGGGDAAPCLRNGPIKSDQMLVDTQTGALKNVIIYFAENTKRKAKPELWVHPDAAPEANTTPVVFDQNVCMFTSHVVGMQVAQPLIIRNSDTVGHNTKLDNSKPISPLLAAGSEAKPYLHAKEERQPYGVSCNIHPWMTAFILPRDNAYFAVTGEDGKFTLENLPAGVDLTIKVWHEKAGFIQSVTVNGEKKNWPSKGFTETVPKDGQKQLEIVLDAGPFSR